MRRLARLGALIVLMVDGLYLIIVRGQGGADSRSLRVPFIVALLAGFALIALLATHPRLQRLSPLMLSASAAGLAAIGVLAIFSIGLAILLATSPMGIAAVLAISRSDWQPGAMQALGGALVGLALVIGGMDLTELPVSCPPNGGGGGSGYRLLSGPYHWTCANGKLTVKSGECSSYSTSIAPDGTVTSTGC